MVVGLPPESVDVFGAADYVVFAVPGGGANGVSPEEDVADGTVLAVEEVLGVEGGEVPRQDERQEEKGQSEPAQTTARDVVLCCCHCGYNRDLPTETERKGRKLARRLVQASVGGKPTSSEHHPRLLFQAL